MASGDESVRNNVKVNENTDGGKWFANDEIKMNKMPTWDKVRPRPRVTECYNVTDESVM